MGDDGMGEVERVEGTCTTMTSTTVATTTTAATTYKLLRGIDLILVFLEERHCSSLSPSLHRLPSRVMSEVGGWRKAEDGS